MHKINLLYIKTIVDLCFGIRGMLFNSKLNHIDLRSASVNMTFLLFNNTPCLPQHKSIVVQYIPVHDISVLIASASSEGSGESARMRRLARAFAARIHEVQ